MKLSGEGGRRNPPSSSLAEREYEGGTRCPQRVGLGKKAGDSIQRLEGKPLHLKALIPVLSTGA